MHLIRSLQPLPIKASVVSVGNFDGVHCGHMMLIRETVRRARMRRAQSVIVTFEPHTRVVTSPHQIQPILTTLEEKALLIGSLGVDYLVCLKFDRALMSLSPAEFIKRILIGRCKAVEWVMGQGHTFGSQRRGSAEFLRRHVDIKHFSLFVAKTARTGDTIVSSTEIRRRIVAGQVADALRLLGHPYLIITRRIRGVRKARQLGFPTINFEAVREPKVLPMPGVYAARLEFAGRRHCGALYWGDCPTFANRDFHFEFHLFGPPGKALRAGAKACIGLYHCIRHDRAFKNQDALARRIADDVNEIKRYFT
jgi:riboflavin kinase/FMN adenylyltransferase